jgi:N6-adenosine-specific RNA methylase IME4
LDGIPAGIRFGAILADPPLEFKAYSKKGNKRSPQRHYPCSALDELCDLPVAAYAARDCCLFLWWPTHHTNQLFESELLSRWGFTFSGLGFDWLKTTKNAFVSPTEIRAAPGAKSPWHFGLGHTTRKNTELCWLGRRGNPPRLDKGVFSVLVAPVRLHSRKPDEIYRLIETYCAGPFLELWARQRWPGWTACGDELGKFGS